MENIKQVHRMKKLAIILFLLIAVTGHAQFFEYTTSATNSNAGAKSRAWVALQTGVVVSSGSTITITPGLPVLTTGSYPGLYAGTSGTSSYATNAGKILGTTPSSFSLGVFATGTDAASWRSGIGAGTSSLTLGSGSGQALESTAIALQALLNTGTFNLTGTSSFATNAGQLNGHADTYFATSGSTDALYSILTSGTISAVDQTARDIATSGTISGIDSTARTTGSNSITQGVIAKLELPVYDGNQDVVHVDVLKASGTSYIFGYRYWAAYTPYPAASRELPCVAASKDGINWEIPANCPNPLWTASQILATGTTLWDVYGDTDITLMPDGSVGVFFIASDVGSSNSVFLTTSTNGYTWSTPTVVYSGTIGADASIASPCVVTESGSNMTMFYSQLTPPSTHQIVKISSTTAGTTWGDPVVVATPPSPGAGIDDWYPWHADCIKVSGTYQMLITLTYYTSQAARHNEHILAHWVSTSGTSFTAVTTPPTPAVPWLSWDLMRENYRSSITANDDGTFDAWVTCMGPGTTITDSISNRVARFENVALSGSDEIAAGSLSFGPRSNYITNAMHNSATVVLDNDITISGTTGFQNLTLLSAGNNPDGLSYLGFNVKAGETVGFSARAYLTDASSTDNYKIAVGKAGTSTGIARFSFGKAGGSTSFYWTSAFSSGQATIGAQGFVGNGATHQLVVDGECTIDSTDGVLNFQAAQTTGTSSAIVVKKGSSFTIYRNPAPR